MIRYRVKIGCHYIGNRVYKKGDVFEIPCDTLDTGHGSVLFKKLGKSAPVVPPTADRALDAVDPEIKAHMVKEPMLEPIAAQPVRKSRGSRKQKK